MIWKVITDGEKSALYESEVIHGISFEILENKQYQHQETNGYLLFERSKMELYSRSGTPYGGLGLFCAIGAPLEGIFDSVRDAQRVAETIIKRT